MESAKLFSQRAKLRRGLIEVYLAKPAKLRGLIDHRFVIFFRSRQTRTARNSPQLPSRSKGSLVEQPTDPRVPRQQDTKACRCPDGELQSVSRRGTTFRVEPERQCSPGKTLALHAVVRRVHSTSCGEEPHPEEQITP